MEPIANRFELLTRPESLEQSDVDKDHPVEDVADLLSDNLSEVNELESEAEELTEQFALGEIDDVHKVTVATEKARLALQLTTEVQNRVVEAYDDIMRMQI